MAFTTEEQVVLNGPNVSWFTTYGTLLAGASHGESDIIWYHVGGLGGLNRFSIHLSGMKSTLASIDIDIIPFWALVRGEPLDIPVGFWTGIATGIAPAVTSAVGVWGSDGLATATTGTAVHAPWLYSAEYIGFGVKNAGAKSLDQLVIHFNGETVR